MFLLLTEVYGSLGASLLPLLQMLDSEFNANILMTSSETSTRTGQWGIANLFPHAGLSLLLLTMLDP